ncbi:hypothetical protein [Anaerofustis stercorihominis]|uniref:hypothetical protein n=1 Tax=Anaerofustis stercorihominis TaxID=214853 RepID=UPI0026737137|nr:hypothetical protein [Anaerofustis stercorihominis]
MDGGTMEDNNLFLTLEIKSESNKEILYLNGIKLKGVSDYEIKKSPALPPRTAELDLKLLVLLI